LLSAKGAVSGVFAYYPHPGGEGQPNLDNPLYTLGWFKISMYTKHFLCYRNQHQSGCGM